MEIIMKVFIKRITALCFVFLFFVLITKIISALTGWTWSEVLIILLWYDKIADEINKRIK
jgi:ABC-type uncharacterized transport system permease subunit